MRAKLHLQQQDTDPVLYERQYFVTVSGARNFQSTYQWRSLEDEVKVFLITLSIFPNRTIGRIAVFSINNAEWSFLHDYFGKAMEVSKLERIEKVDPDSKTVLEKVEKDEEKLLAYAKMLFGVEAA